MLSPRLSPKPADELLRDWSDWSSRPAADSAADDPTERAVSTREAIRPEPGRTPVIPYVVEARTIRSADLTSYNLLLVVQVRRGFEYDGDHLRASTKPDNVGHVQIHDLLIRNPKNRNVGRGTVLLAALERMCRLRGHRWIAGGISSADDMMRVEAFYRHRGYTVVKGIPDIPFQWQVLKEL